MCSEVEYEVDEVNDVGIIICELARVAHHCEFRVFFLDLTNSVEQCASALSSILSNVGNQPNDQGERKNSSLITNAMLIGKINHFYA